MIAFLRGELAAVRSDTAIIETGGIGYEVMMPAASLERLGPAGSQVTVHTYLYVREDNIGLFGFLDPDELDLFKQLISVSGVGPKAALAILSVLSADALRLAIVAEDAKTISKAPGVGAKTARRLIVELKDKISLSAEDGGYQGDEPELSADRSSAAEDAVMALTALGYSSSEAVRAVRLVENASELDAEQLLKQALKKIMF